MGVSRPSLLHESTDSMMISVQLATTFCTNLHVDLKISVTISVIAYPMNGRSVTDLYPELSHFISHCKKRGHASSCLQQPCCTKI